MFYWKDYSNFWLWLRLMNSQTYLWDLETIQSVWKGDNIQITQKILTATSWISLRNCKNLTNPLLSCSWLIISTAKWRSLEFVIRYFFTWRNCYFFKSSFCQFIKYMHDSLQKLKMLSWGVAFTQRF